VVTTIIITTVIITTLSPPESASRAATLAHPRRRFLPPSTLPRIGSADRVGEAAGGARVTVEATLWAVTAVDPSVERPSVERPSVERPGRRGATAVPGPSGCSGHGTGSSTSEGMVYSAIRSISPSSASLKT
jgi:hypothetical protein